LKTIDSKFKITIFYLEMALFSLEKPVFLPVYCHHNK